jgi:hypothetical protein
MSVPIAAIKTYSHTHNYKPEADRAQDAVEAAEEDLKELKKANQQVWLVLCRMHSTHLATQQEQGHTQHHELLCYAG